MSLIKDTWRQLVRRRLWPVAVLLLGALVAVPVLLAHDAAVPPPASSTAPAEEAAAPVGGGLEEPVVAMAEESSRGRRHVLGPRKDPFKPAPQPKVKKPKAQAPHTATAPAPPSSSSGTHATIPSGGVGSAGPTSPSGGGAPYTPAPTTPVVTPQPTPTPAPKPKVDPGTLTVNFGNAESGSLERMKVKKLQALPDADTPVAIYLGPGKDNRTALFLVDATVRPEGDGSCRPSPADCQKVELREGETEFFDVLDEAGTVVSQYELDLVDVAGKPRPKAKGARAHHARAAHASGARVTIARLVRLLKP